LAGPTNVGASVKRLAIGVLLPLIVVLVFGGLLVAANPLIETWLEHLEGPAWNFHLDPQRLTLWLILAWASWPFLAVARVVMRRKAETTANTRAEPASVIWRSGNLFINAGSLMLSLVEFVEALYPRCREEPAFRDLKRVRRDA
jgi:hypothetical protein